MRAATIFFVAAWGVVSLAAACSSGNEQSPVQGDGGSPGEGGVMPPPPHWPCSGSAAACLSGTVSTSSFSAKPQVLVAWLYGLFPASGTSVQLAQQTVATDGTWAFSNLPAWGHYYVQIAAGFGQTYGPSATVGPLTVPSSAPVAVQVRPVQIMASEQQGMGGSLGLDWVSAYAFDPASGAELQGNAASVSVAVGGTSTPLPWTTNGKQSVYIAQFSQPPAAQASYTVTTSGAAFGAMPASWQVTAAPPTFTPSITTMQTTMGSQDVLTVSWPAQPTADYVTVAVFQATTGGALVASTDPIAADKSPWLDSGSSATAQLPLPATDGGAVNYVVDAYFTTASCPTTADGCVLSSVVAAAQITSP
jgi:hypothetical protein